MRIHGSFPALRYLWQYTFIYPCLGGGGSEQPRSKRLTVPVADIHTRPARVPRYRPPPVFQRPTRAEHNRAVRERPSEGVRFASPKRARGSVPTTERLSDRGRERGCDRQPSCYSDPRRQQKRGVGLRARSCSYKMWVSFRMDEEFHELSRESKNEDETTLDGDKAIK